MLLLKSLNSPSASSTEIKLQQEHFSNMPASLSSPEMLQAIINAAVGILALSLTTEFSSVTFIWSPRRNLNTNPWSTTIKGENPTTLGEMWLYYKEEVAFLHSAPEKD